MTTSNLSQQKCQPCDGNMHPLLPAAIDPLMQQLQGWQQYDHLISRTYHFKNYYQTIAFVNAVAWLSHRENHHPELGVSFNECRVEYTTHALHGLSENDFICAAKVDALYHA
ncbi:MAG: 4a-hydroxytetrahydrobiopterin dehydratase [Gallionella sp.]